MRSKTATVPDPFLLDGTPSQLVPIYRLPVRGQPEGDPTIGAGEYRPHVSGQPCNRPGTSSRRSVCVGSNVERDRILPRNERNLAARAPSALQLNLIGVVGSWVASQTVGTHLDVAAMVASHSTASCLIGLQSPNGRIATAFQFEVGQLVCFIRGSPPAGSNRRWSRAAPLSLSCPTARAASTKSPEFRMPFVCIQYSRTATCQSFERPFGVRCRSGSASSRSM